MRAMRSWPRPAPRFFFDSTHSFEKKKNKERGAVAIRWLPFSIEPLIIRKKKRRERREGGGEGERLAKANPQYYSSFRGGEKEENPTSRSSDTEKGEGGRREERARMNLSIFATSTRGESGKK